MITQKDIDIFWEEFQKETNKEKREESWVMAPIPDVVNHPIHYTSHPSGVEAIQITEHMSFLMGNAMKYLWRADLKNGVEDLRKAIFYIEREIENRTKNNK